MKKSAVIFVVLFSTILLSAPKNGNEKKESEDTKISDQLVSIVTSIIRGEDYTQFKANISPEAYLISNKSYESIFEILSNPAKQSELIEGKDTKIQFFSLRMPDNQKDAYMVLETKSGDNQESNWHSVFFKLNENNTWQILGWHIS